MAQTVTFGDRLRRHRVAAGLTQEELAERAGISARAVSDLERGVILTPRRDTLQLLAEALGLEEEERAALEALRRAPSPDARGKDAPATPVAPALNGMVVVLIADLRGYTRFTEERGDHAAARLTALFAKLAGQAAAAQGGRVLEVRGDEVLATFASARGALRAAVDLQALCVSNDTSDAPLRPGIGLDVGEPVAVGGGYRGESLNRAARLCALAGPGEILAADGLLHLAGRVEGLVYQDRGPMTLKGLAEPLHVRQVLAPGILHVAAPRNPFKGLRPFTGADAGDFFGRERLVAALVTALNPERPAPPRFLAVVGPSGAGKSSVVLAGLLHRLRQGALPGSADWLYLEPLVPGAHPLEALTVALAQVFPGTSLQAIRDDLDASPRGLHLLAERLTAGTARQVVLVVDQFEELFTLTADEVERQHFIALLVAAVNESRGVLLAVVTLRADFYDRPLSYAALIPLLEAHAKLVPPLALGELREAIEQPALLSDVNLLFEEGLVGELLDAVRGQAGALPLLQFTLAQLYERREGRVLTLAAYQALGGVHGALARHAEDTFAALPSEEHRLLACALFLRLVELGVNEQDVTRRRVAMAELVLPDVHQTAVLRETGGTFVGARLLVTSDVGGSSTLEVSHEALLGAWPRLQGWLAEDRSGLLVHRRLTEAAGEWGRARDDSALYRGARLATVLEWQERTATTLNEAEDAFVRASLELHAREGRAARRRLWLAASGLLIALVVVSVAAVVAFEQRQVALQESKQTREQRQVALRERDIATSRELAANALVQSSVDPELAVLLAGEAVRLGPGTAQAEDALRLALLRSHGRLVLRHADKVYSAVFSPDGRRVVTTSADRTARVWDARTGRSMALIHESGSIYSAAFSRDGQFIVTPGGVSAATDAATVWSAQTGRRVVALWNVRNDRQLAALGGGGLPNVAFSPDGRFVLGAPTPGGSARVWDARTGNTVAIVPGAPAAGCYSGVQCGRVAFSPDGRFVVVVGGADRTVILWDMQRRATVAVLNNGSIVHDAAFSPDSRFVVTASADGTAGLWNARTGQSVAVLHGHTGDVLGAAFSPDGHYIVTAGADATARVWDAVTGASVAVLQGHTGKVYSATFSPDSRFVVTASADGTARVWNASAAASLGVLLGHTGEVLGASFSPDGRSILTSSVDGTARIWEAPTGQSLRDLQGHADSLTSATFSSDSRFVVTASADGTARLWDAGTGRALTTLRGHAGRVDRAVFSADGTRVLTAGLDGTARLWDSRTGQAMGTLQGPAGETFSATFSPDGALVLTASDDSMARLWDVRTARVLRTLQGHLREVTDATFSPDGILLATASADGTARLWDARSGQGIAVLRGHTGKANSVAFSPDGQRVVTAGDDHTARMWDSRTGRALGSLRGHTDAVMSATFSPDGLLLLTASLDGTARVWDVRTRENVLTFQGQGTPLATATFSPDGRYVVTAGADLVAHLYSCDVCGSTRDLLALARVRVSRQLTAVERATYLQ